MKGISHERQTNICLILPFHMCICAIINVSNKGQKKEQVRDWLFIK